jgi:hypothetical protein
LRSESLLGASCVMGKSLSTTSNTRRQELLGQPPASTIMSHLIYHKTIIVRHSYCKPHCCSEYLPPYTCLIHVSCYERRTQQLLIPPLADPRPSLKRACRSRCRSQPSEPLTRRACTECFCSEGLRARCAGIRSLRRNKLISIQHHSALPLGPIATHNFFFKSALQYVATPY